MSAAPHMEDHLDEPVTYALQRIQGRLLAQTTYFGVEAVKCPLDAWIYQEIIHETRPDVIVEIGVFHGGGTLYLAHLCDLLDHGRVIGIDVDLSNVAVPVREHDRIRLIQSDACAAFRQVRDLVSVGASVLVVEDSSHTYENTLAVLRTYSELVQPGGYFIVEDTNCHHGIDSGPKPGPYEAVESFLAECSDFDSDRTREAFFITWNPNGFLRRTQ